MMPNLCASRSRRYSCTALPPRDRYPNQECEEPPRIPTTRPAQPACNTKSRPRRIAPPTAVPTACLRITHPVIRVRNPVAHCFFSRRGSKPFRASPPPPTLPCPPPRAPRRVRHEKKPRRARLRRRPSSNARRASAAMDPRAMPSAAATSVAPPLPLRRPSVGTRRRCITSCAPSSTRRRLVPRPRRAMAYRVTRRCQIRRRTSRPV